MKIYSKIDEQFRQSIIDEFKRDSDAHVPSGKLSASMLGKPLLWQVLKHIGIPPKQATDEYLFMKFQRGREVELSFLSRLDAIKEKQKKVEYRDCVGIIDAVVETPEYGAIPLEVKSVTSMKYRRIIKEGVPDDQYQLQGALYALAMGTPHYLISIVNSDDFRPLTFLCSIDGIRDRIDSIIDKYQQALLERAIPPFEAKYQWQNNVDYQDYPDFSTLTPSQILEKLKVEYPKEYLKWVK